jgi:hypothetical protein
MLTYCAECKSDCDETHPLPWSMAHLAYANQRKASLAPMSLPTTICRSSSGLTLTPTQLIARAEVLAARGQRQPLTIREAEATVSELRTPDATRRAMAREEDDMIIRASALRRH